MTGESKLNVTLFLVGLTSIVAGSSLVGGLGGGLIAAGGCLLYVWGK